MSCEGIGNLHYFYVHSVFILAGSVLPAMFLLGLQLSGSYFGGLASGIAFMSNHGHATRVMWTPPLRESFGYPVFYLQLCLLTWILRKSSVNKIAYLILTSITTHFILFWQLPVRSFHSQKDFDYFSAAFKQHFNGRIAQIFESSC